MDKLTLLISLLPVVFMIHDFEEIIFFKPWLRKNAPVLEEKFPRLAKRLLPRFLGLSTAGFAMTVALEFAAIVAVTYGSLLSGFSQLWFGVFLIFFAHLVVHICQWIAFGFRYVPVVVTSFLGLPYCVYTLAEVVGRGLFTPAESAAWALAAAAAGAALYALGHKLGKRLGRDGAAEPEKEGTVRDGLRYHHIGIPVKEPVEGEVYLEAYKLHHFGYESSEYGVELMRYDEDCPLPEIVKTKPHVAFEVADLAEAVRGKRVIIAPNSPSEGNLVAFIEENGIPVELIETKRRPANEAPARTNGASLEHVALWTDDIERCVRFYAGYFGALAGEPYHNSAKGFESRFLAFEDGTRLEVMKTTRLFPTRSEPGAERVGLTHLALAVGDEARVDELTRRLKDDGFPVLDGPRRTGDGYYESVVLDPDGNRVELCAGPVAPRKEVFPCVNP